MKVCTKCGKHKKQEEFSKDSSKKDGFYSSCKLCVKIYKKQYNVANKEKNYERVKKWAVNNPEKRKLIQNKYNNSIKGKEITKKWRINNADKIKKDKKEWTRNNLEKVRSYKRKYQVNNAIKIRNSTSYKEYRRKWKKNRLKNDPIFKLKNNISCLIRNSMRGSKSELTVNILQITIEDFKIYLENLFSEGMNWDNYGEWHLDHIIPVSYAKSREDLVILNRFFNFQPLWAKDNLKKSDTLPDNVEELFEKLKNSTENQ